MAQSQVLHIEKDATVAGGTANAAGESISYTMTVANTGNAAITGVVVSDPFMTNVTPVAVAPSTSATTTPTLLEVGETWSFTASHAVTQAELDAGDNIVNTATADADQTTRTPTTPRSRWRRARS